MNCRSLTLLCSFALLSACMPDPPARDAGDPAYVRQVVPMLLGRPPINSEEARFFSDVVQGRTSPSEGRVALLRGLMRSDEFAEHWSEFLLRHADVDRESDVLKSCFERPLQASSPLIGLALSTSRMHEDAETGTINGADVLSSVFASRRSDISPFLRANLLTTHAGRARSAAPANIAAGVQQTYLDRQLDCMGCHNSYYATTSAGSGWRRHYPMLGFFERSLYGAHDGPLNEGAVSEVFRLGASTAPVACTSGSCTDRAQPWASLSRACGDFVARAEVPRARSPVQLGSLSGNEANLWDLEDMFRDGVDQMRGSWLNPTVGDGDQMCLNCPLGRFQAVVQDTCMSCHNPERAPSLGIFHFVPGARVSDLQVQPFSATAPRPAAVPLYGTDEAAQRYRALIASYVAGGIMPPYEIGIPDSEREQIQATVASAMASGAASSCRCNRVAIGRSVDPAKAFAFLTAANVVNSVWTEAFGRSLTVPNHFPRTRAQASALEFLTQRFVNEGWSLRALLERVLLGKFFSRAAPAERAATEPLTAHFEVPPVYDPWSQVDRRRDREPDATGFNNAMTESIRRRPVRTLLQSAHSALGWPAPSRFPGASEPSFSTQQQLGNRLSATARGTVDADLQNLLAWEDYAAACQHPSGGDDWIDSLLVRATALGSSREHTIIALKDRLIGEPWLSEGSERDGLNTTFGDLSAAVSAGDEPELRGLCGVLLKSPQFMLQGLTPSAARSRVPPRAMPLACGAEGNCDYAAFCQAWSPAFERAGYTLSCPAPSLIAKGYAAEIGLKLATGIDGIQSICTGGLCGFMEAVSADQCAKDALACLPGGLMACDTRCSGMFCCGAALQDIDATFAEGRRGLLYTVADESKVHHALGVTRISKGGSTTKLGAGDMLHAGDILRFSRGAELKAEGPYGEMLTPAKGLQFNTKTNTLDLLIGRIDKVEVDEDEYWGSVQPGALRQTQFVDRVESWTQARIQAQEDALNAQIKKEQANGPLQPEGKLVGAEQPVDPKKLILPKKLTPKPAPIKPN